MSPQPDPPDPPASHPPPEGVTRVDPQAQGNASGSSAHGSGLHAHETPSIPDHTLIKQIGRGAYGEVWLARNIMGTYRAVKIVHRSSFDSDRPYEREFSGIKRFEPISRSHESQVDILHVGRNEDQGYFFYVMELADDLHHGREIDPETYTPSTLRNQLRQRQRFTPADALQISLALATALDHLHRNGLIHRDIKPPNVIFVNGLPKLADIGLVSITGENLSFVGTEGYLPPEGPGTVQSDIYSLGKTLYEAATGKDRMDFPELPTLTGPDAEESSLFELNEVLIRACHRDPTRRYSTVGELHADLVLLQAGKSLRRSRLLEHRLALLARTLSGLILAAGIAAGAFLYQRSQTHEARRLAAQNQELVARESAEKERAEALLRTLHLKETERFFADDEASKGVAYLSWLLRNNPSDRVAATRLISALLHRPFPVPVRVLEYPAVPHKTASSSDQSLFVAWNHEKTNNIAWLVRADTGDLVGEPMPHPQPIRTAVFSPDARRVATACEDGAVRLWDTLNGRPVGAALPHPRRDQAGTELYPPQLSSLAFSPDSRSLATLSEGLLRVWDHERQHLRFPPIPFAGGEGTALFTRDGTRIVVSSSSPVKPVFDATTGQQVGTFTHPEPESHSDIPPTVMSPDGRLLAAQAWDTVYLWDVTTYQLLRTLPNRAMITQIAISPDSQRLATTDVDQTAKVWDIETGRMSAGPMPHKETPWLLAFDSTGERLLTQEPPRWRVWDSRTGTPLTEWIPGWSAHALNPAGDRFWSSPVVPAPRLSMIQWEFTGEPARLALWLPSRAETVRFHPDGQRLLATRAHVARFSRGAATQGYLLLDTRTATSLLPPIEDSLGFISAQFNADGTRFAVAAVVGYAQVYATATGKPITPRLWSDRSMTRASFSPDGSRILTTSTDNFLRIWDAVRGQLLVGPIFESKELTDAFWHPAGDRIATRSEVSAPQIYNAHTGTPIPLSLSPPAPADHPIRILRFSPDGKWLVLALKGGGVHLYEAASGKALRPLPRHSDHIVQMEFSPNGDYLATGGWDETIRVSRLPSGTLVGEPLTHQGPVRTLQFNHDGSRLVSGSSDGTTRIWDVATSRPISEPFRGAWVNDVAISPNGQRIASASMDGRIEIRDLPQPTTDTPAWFLDLAEALGGQRMTQPGVFGPIDSSSLLEARKRLLASTNTDTYTQVAQWLMRDRATRTTTLSSQLTLHDQIGRLTLDQPITALRSLLHAVPSSVTALAHLAWQRALEPSRPQHEPDPNTTAKHLVERALTLAPSNSLAWQTRAHLLAKSGSYASAIADLDKVTRFAPDHIDAWMQKARLFQELGQVTNAIHAYTHCLKTLAAQANPPPADNPSDSQRRFCLLARSDLHVRNGRIDLAIADRTEALGIPPRPPHTPPQLIDLSAHYHRTLQEEQFFTGDNAGPVVDNLASLANWTNRIRGIRFDIRGTIRLDSQAGTNPPPQRLSESLHARGIPIHQAGQRLHLLHALMSGPIGSPSLLMRVHYSDGKTELVPIHRGRHIMAWDNATAESAEEAIPAWTELNAYGDTRGRVSQLHLWSWENPHPDVPITTLDLELAGTPGTGNEIGYVLAGLTLQTEPTPTWVKHPESQHATAGQSVTLHASARSGHSLHYQWFRDEQPIPGATNQVLHFPSLTPDHAGVYHLQVWNRLTNSILAVSSNPAYLTITTPGWVHGRLRMETYRDSQGESLTTLTNLTRFPSQPDLVQWVHHFEAPSNGGDRFGTRLSGYLTPPKTGMYRFYISSDDQGALFLSEDETPEKIRRIAFEPGWNRDRCWRVQHLRHHQENQSPLIPLQAGQRYYIEALHQEGGGSDNIGVTWQLPGDPEPENLAPPIPGRYLSVPASWKIDPRPTP